MCVSIGAARVGVGQTPAVDFVDTRFLGAALSCPLFLGAGQQRVQVGQQRPHFLGLQHRRLDEQRRRAGGDE